MLGEKNEADVKRIAEVLAQHGDKLDDHGRKLEYITKALEPLARLDAFVQLVAHKHEVRLTDLETHTGLRASRDPGA